MSSVGVDLPPTPYATDHNDDDDDDDDDNLGLSILQTFSCLASRKIDKNKQKTNNIFIACVVYYHRFFCLSVCLFRISNITRKRLDRFA